MNVRYWLSRGTPIGLTLLGVFVGVGGAFGAVLFDILISFSTQVFYGTTIDGNFLATLDAMSPWRRMLIPAAGGLLVGIILYLSKAHEAEGEGVPEVEEALAHKRGRIRPIVAPIKLITAVLTLGSGGSAGREGPVIQMGSALGSSVSQFFKHNTEDRSLLLAAGAAAAIGGTFGAPLGGVLFTIEILRHKPSILRSLIIFLAAFTGDAAARLITGHEGLRFIATDQLPFMTVSSLVLLATTIACVFIALLFILVLKKSREFVSGVPLPHIIKPALGGLLVGVIGLFIPLIHEPATYPFMTELVTTSTVSIVMLGMLLIIKILATASTLSSGGSGGVFAPLLLLGGIVGSLATTFLSQYFSVEVGSSFVVMGMAAVFAAAAHAPLTAALITFEITQNSTLLIPLIIVCVVASSLSRILKKESIYSIDD